MTRYGFVLSSDGSKSSFEIGAWKALRELKLDINSVSGSFVGALNAALIAQNDFEKAVRFWRNIASKQLLGVNRHIAQRYTEDWSRTDTKAFKKNYMMYVNGRSEELDPLRDVIDMFIDEKAVRKSDVDFGFISISLQTLEAEMLTLKTIPNGKLNQYLLAAACFPQITQTNRAADPQFSAQYSPYILGKKFKSDIIISTDEVNIIPPNLKSEVEIIRSSEVMELNINETAEQMKKNIKMGYTDTLKAFHPSLGNKYFIPEAIPCEKFNIFKRKIGKSTNQQVDYLVKMILRLKEPTVRNINIRLAQMMKGGQVQCSDTYYALLENAALILGIPTNERYTPDSLIAALLSTITQKIRENKGKFASADFVKELIKSAQSPGNSYPGADLFVQYFLLLLSCKPQVYSKLVPVLSAMNIKTLAAFVTFLYLLY